MGIRHEDLANQTTAFREGLKKALDHIKLVHITTLLDVPDDIEDRLKDATNDGRLIIETDGSVRFTKGLPAKRPVENDIDDIVESLEEDLEDEDE